MRQKITYVLKYNLLTALLLTGAICCAVGATWCRYQKTIEAPASFIIEGPGDFVILGPEEGTKPGIWCVDEEAGLARMDFQVANGVEENFATEDGVFRLRLLATEGIPANAEVSLVVINEEGIRQTYPIHAEQIAFEGKYLALCNEMGDGTRYRFMDGDRELVLKLDGGKRSVLKCSIVVKGNVEPFLAEMQLMDAAYGNEADILTNYVDKVEEKPSFLLPQWTSGEEAPQTELFLSTQDVRTEGKLVVRTESTLVSPVLEKMDVESVSDKETVQELEVIVEPDEVQEVKLTLVPDETLLKDLTDPVTVKADVTWSFTNEEGEAEELAVELVAVLNPAKELMPSEPSEESSEAGSEPSEESSESGNAPSEENSESGSAPSEENSESGSAPSEESSEGSSEPNEESSEDSEEPSEESNEDSGEPSEESDESGSVSGEESSEADEADCILMLTFEAGEPDISTEVEEASEFNDFIETSELSDSTEAGEPSDSSESSESTEASEPSISTEEEEFSTFVVKKQNAKHQMALTGLVQKLSLTESIAGQVTYIGEETPTTSQQLQELHIVSHLAVWGFSIPESNLVVETTMEGLAAEGYQKVENSPAPKVTISDVTEGDFEGGKFVTIQGNNALAGTYRLIFTQKTDDNLVVHTEYIPIFVNYRFEDALKAEAQEE